MEKILQTTVQVPQRGAGNIIRQQDVTFEIFKEEDRYKAVSQLSTDERRIVNIPTELIFKIENEKPISLLSERDGNFHIINALADKIREQGANDWWILYDFIFNSRRDFDLRYRLVNASYDD